MDTITPETHPAGTVLFAYRSSFGRNSRIGPKAEIVKWTPGGKARLSDGTLAKVLGDHWGRTRLRASKVDWFVLTDEDTAAEAKHVSADRARNLLSLLRDVRTREVSDDKALAAEVHIRAALEALGVSGV